MQKDERGLQSADRAVAVVGVGALLPDAPDAASFWRNVLEGRDSITEVPPDRWSPADFYDPDPAAPDKTYCKIGAFVRGFQFDSLKLRIPPRVAASMDVAQQWMLVCARDALADAGLPEGKLDPERTGVIVANALGGEMHERTTMRTAWPEMAHALEASPELAALPPEARAALIRTAGKRFLDGLPVINEDAMPGELGNVIAGRVANVLDLHGPNFTVDAACASSLAALDTAMAALAERRVDAVVTGGVDRTMSPSTFVKFAKIGALSPDGSRPFDAGANGFVMGEGCVALVLRRLEDAERDGNRIYAVIRAIGASSDGRGKGITAPNPVGQRFAIRRAYEQGGFSPASVGLVEAHGTSTKVGDATEAESLAAMFEGSGLPARSIALGSVKSQIGHLKSAAGAAGLLKAVFALHHKVLPPTINVRTPNPAIPFDRVPLYLSLEARPWERPATGIRRATVSAFGFGGTNFHVVLDEHVPGMLTSGRRVQASVPEKLVPPAPGVAVAGARDARELGQRLGELARAARAGGTPTGVRAQDLAAPERVAIAYASPADLADKADQAVAALAGGDPRVWKLLRARGVFRGSGPKAKLAFLFPGQGSQYLGMLAGLRASEPEVRDAFAEADAVMAERLPGRLSDYVYAAVSDQAETALRDTNVCQPAMLAADIGLFRLLGRFGFAPDMVMGHSLGEYAALVAAGAMPFADAVKAVSARAREMAGVSIADNGKMASVFGPAELIERTIRDVDGYVVPANYNSRSQTVIGGGTRAVEQAVARFGAAGVKAVELPVSHAFHTEIVAGASQPLHRMLAGLSLGVPALPTISNVTGEPYPSGAGAREQMLALMARQVAAPVQFVRGLESLYRLGARVFVEVGPRKVLASFVEDVLGAHEDVVALASNQPKLGERPSLAMVIAGLYAAGHGTPTAATEEHEMAVQSRSSAPSAELVASTTAAALTAAATGPASDTHQELGRLFARFLEDGMRIYQGRGANGAAASAPAPASAPTAAPVVAAGSVVVTGASLGLPGRGRRVFNDDNFDRILRGETFIEALPGDVRQRLADKRVVRLVKAPDGAARMEEITDPAAVLKLAGQRGELDLEGEFGVSRERTEAFDVTTKLAVGAALLALRDAGIPLVRRYRQTSRGTYLPDRWVLPDSLADETGVVFASAFPGYEALLGDVESFHEDRALRGLIAELEAVRARVDGSAARAIDERLAALRSQLERSAFSFDRKFLFKVLAMGHSQLAELIGIRGPNVQVNAACASAAVGLSVAHDWIRSGRCRRVVVVSADDAASGRNFDWIGAGFLASGAATTEADISLAALPFDRRRNGLIVGMGASGLVVESEDAVRERGRRGIAEIVAIETSNSAFHGTRLDVEHISECMERLVAGVEKRHGISREEIARNGVFVSHETYTPARGGSAAAEIHSLRRAFGPNVASLIVANTKGMTGHPMGAGVEEATAVKMLETGVVPPVPNLREPDPDLGDLRLSTGGQYPLRYALRLAAGFGSQLVLSLFRKVRGPRVADEARYQRWVAEQSGRAAPALVVEQNTLRVRDDGPPAVRPAASRWVPGTGPTLMAEVEGGESRSAAPAPVPASVQPAVRTVPVAPLTASVPAVAASSAPAAAAPAPAAPAASGGVGEKLLAVVSRKTGYPREMLALDLDLEADLGIDTVKQAEIFAEIRAAFELPRRDDLRLRDYPTLKHLIGLVEQLRPELVASAGSASQTTATVAGSASSHPSSSPAPLPAQVAAPSAAAPGGAPAGSGTIADRLLAVVAQKTGYPRDMLALDLDLEADLGIDTVKQAEIFAEIRGAFELPRRDDLRLRDYPTLGHLIGLVAQLRPDLAAAASQTSVTAGAPAAGQPAPSHVAQSGQPVAASQAAPGGAIADRLLSVVAGKTGYPRDMLALDLDLEADLGIDTVKQAEIFAEIRGAFELPRRDDLRLRDYPTLGHLIGLVAQLRPDLAGPAAAGVAASAAAAAPMTPGASSFAAAAGATTTQAPGAAPTATPGSAAASAAAMAPSAAGPADDVTERMLAVVAQKTGYPSEMLALDLDLEADLGIDTVKQAEIFAEIRATFGLPRRDDLRLRDYPTLGHLIALVRELRAPASEAPAAGSAQPASPAPGAVKAGGVVRRVPTPVLRPDLDLCKPTGIELGQGKRVVVIPDQGGIGAALVRELEARGVTVLQPTDGPVAEQAAEWVAQGGVDGVYHLAALDPEPELLAASLDEMRAVLEARVHRLVRLCRASMPSLGRAGTFVVAATRLGGLHGYGPEGALAPVGGAVGGFVKALGRECPDALVKVVDFGDVDEKVAAGALVGETLRDRAVVEVGYAWGARHAVGLEVTERAVPEKPLALHEDGVVLVTGAAGGITAAIVRDLAAASHATFYLTDVVPAPDPHDPDLARLGDRDGLRRDLFARMKATSERVTPAQVEAKIAGLERQKAVLDAMTGVEASGGRVVYRAGDVRDATVVGALVDEIRKAHGRIDLVVHAAGLERSRFLADKPDEEFARVFDVKVLGLCNVLRSLDATPLGAVVCFSSVAGRFGNAGQTDYSAANDFLCKAMSTLRRVRPDTRALAIDWTAWGDVGMATRGSIPEMMRRAGIDMLPLADGLPIVRQEVEAGTRGEVVIGKGLGVLVAPIDAQGGLDVDALAARMAAARQPMIGRVLGYDLYDGLRIETALDPTAEPFLRDHEIDGVPVLPGVMGIEGFAEVARLLLPDHHVAGIEDVRFEAPYKFHRRQARPGVFRAVLRGEGPDTVLVRVELSSKRTLASGEERETRHFSGTVRLTRTAPGQRRAARVSAKAKGKANGKGKAGGNGKNGGNGTSRSKQGRAIAAADIYRIFFHGPSYRVLDRVDVTEQGVESRMRADLPPALRDDAAALLAPRVIELCLQTAGVYELGVSGRMALPASIDRIVSHEVPREVGGLRAEVQPRKEDGAWCFDARVSDADGRVYLELEGYRTSALPTDPPAELVRPLEAAFARELA